MNMQLFKNITLFFLVLVVCNSCEKSKEVSVRLLNSKCKVKIGKLITIDSLVIDTSFTKVDEENLSKLLPEIKDPALWNVYYYGKCKMGKFKTFSLLLTNGENRSLRLIVIKKRIPICNIEVAGNGQLEGYSYSVSSAIQDDSTLVLRKILTIQTDEPSENAEVNDSIISILRLKPDGYFTVLKIDTIPFSSQYENPDDGEYTDEVFYFNGTSPTSWAIAGISNSRSFKDFYMRFRNMVKLNDKDQIANYIYYPLGSTKDESDFVKNYDKIFTKDIKTAIQTQKVRQLFRDKRGIMIGDNHLWFKQIKGEYKIVTINY